MKLNLTEVESLGDRPLNYQEQPSWMETAAASFKKVKAAELTTSKANYKAEVMGEQLDTLASNDSQFADTYLKLTALSGQHLNLYEEAHKTGTLDNQRFYGGVTAEDVRHYFNKVDEYELYDAKTLDAQAGGYAAKDYYEAEEVLQRSEYFSAELAGGMAGAMLDPVNVALLPTGGTVVKEAGQTILGTAGRAALQEMGIATAAEAVIQPIVYSNKDSMGIEYTVKDAATNAVASIAAAGLLRGSGSAAVDLTVKGKAALKKVDPLLASEYDTLTAGKLKDTSDKHHIDQMNADEPVALTDSEIELKNSPNAKEYQDTPEIDVKPYEGGVAVITDDGGTVKTYKQIGEELDNELDKLKRLEDCYL